MPSASLSPDHPTAACPWHAAVAQAQPAVSGTGSVPGTSHAGPASIQDGAPRALQPTDMLHLPLHKRMVTQYVDGDDGRPELRLFYADKEISFDEPELFTFGETLARQSRFMAGDSLAWGQPGDWPRLQGLLQQLIDEGVLRHADDGDLDERLMGDAGARPSPLAPARTDRPRTWHELPGLMAELTGRPLDIGWLELVVPIFRVAHMSLDAEGRQVGESNAFPAVLRVDVETRWRTCIYSGSRHQDDKPMNVSALKSMRAHWGPAMALLLKLREAYLQRCPEARAGWTVGHLERLSTAVLALPAYQLMRADNPAARRVPNGALHPVLSSMFRVTDGLRMTMHHMLFIPFGEPTRKPDTPMTGPEVHAYAERAFSLHSEHGVCAGPAVMIDEFLSVLVGGQMPRDGLPDTLEPELQAAVADIEPAIDYALLGLKTYAAVFSLWPMTMRVYEQLQTITEAWADHEPTPEVQALQRWLAPIIDRLRTSTHLATEAWRADRDFVYNDMYVQSERALSPAHRSTQPMPSLAEQLAVPPLAGDTPAAQQLAAALHRRFGPGVGEAQRRFRQQWQHTLLQYFAQAQAVVRVACGVQARTNALLGRDAPAQRFQVADIDSYVQLVGMTEGRVPFLLVELATQLGLQVDIDPEAVAIQTIAVPA